MNYTIVYAPLFASIVMLCAIYALFLVLYITERAQRINENREEELRKVKEEDMGKVAEVFQKQRNNLIGLAKKILLYLLVADLLANAIIIILKNYYTFIGIVGGLILPVAGYFVFTFFLFISVGLKGQKIPFFSWLFKGLD